LSRNRTSSQSGWVNPDRLPKGPDGRPLCRYCGEEIPKGRRRTFCSDECVHEHRVRSDPGYARNQVEKRDRGVCALCGLDTEAAAQAYWEQPRLLRVLYSERTGFILGAHGHAWEMDHTLPVIEGGGEAGLDNLRTLCIRCHREQTKLLAARRSKNKTIPTLEAFF